MPQVESTTKDQGQGGLIAMKIPADLHQSIAIEKAYTKRSFQALLREAWDFYTAKHPQPWRESSKRKRGAA